MYAVFGKVEIDSSRADEATELLNNYTVPMVKQAPGFVSGTWARSDDGTRGQSVLLFESEETAKAAAERAPTGPPPGAPVTFVLRRGVRGTRPGLGSGRPQSRNRDRRQPDARPKRTHYVRGWPRASVKPFEILDGDRQGWSGPCV